MPTGAQHWSKEPGRWEASLAPEAWATIPRIQAPLASPAGTRVAYLRGYDGRTDVWVLDLATGTACQLTDRATSQGPDPSQRQAYPLAWTPDSRHVVFAAGDGKLWRVPAGGGASVQLEDAAGHHHSPDVTPDGAWVAYVSERGERGDIFVATTDGAAVRQVTSPTDDEYVANPHWSPDGRRLLFVQWPHYDMPWDEIALVVVDLDSGTRSVIAGGERVVNNWARWSPDGEWIAYVSDRGGQHPNLWRVRPDGSEAERLLPDDRDHMRPAWSPNGACIAFTRFDRMESQIWVWEQSQARQLTSESGVHSEVGWIDDEHLLCSFESPLLPPDLWVIGLDGSRRQLTQCATGGVLGGELVMPRVISWNAGDGLQIEGTLFEPHDRRPGAHPLVVHIHGGPVGQASKNWLPWVQYLVQRGYLVLVPNYRGSKGYGRRFMEALYGDWGGGDLDDYVTGAQAVIAEGFVNPDRVVATGGSAGGYSTLICMTKAPQVFKAGIARYGIADLKTFHEKTWVFERHYLAKLMGGTGGALRALYDDRSPINFVEDVQNPLLILQGDVDIVCHRSEMDKMTAALQAAGKEVEYQVYDHEGHGWKLVSTIIDDAKRSDDFLVRMVLDR